MIGIVGGAGPLAGLDVARKIIEETDAETDQDHLPVLLLSYSCEIPDRTAFLLGKETVNPAVAISRIFMQLEKMGAKAAAIPCNTAHAPAILDAILDELYRLDSKLTILNMVEETAQFIREHFLAETIGVLATTGTCKAGIYANVLQQYGLQVLVPEEIVQQRVHDAIYNPVYGIKATSSPVAQQARLQLVEAVDWLIGNGAEVIVLGCSEIPLAVHEEFIGHIPLIDPNRVLARALIRMVAPSKLKSSIRLSTV